MQYSEIQDVFGLSWWGIDKCISNDEEPKDTAEPEAVGVHI